MDNTNRRRLLTKERKEIYNKCNGHCAYCGAEITFRGMQADHVHPLRRGGADTVENMLPACRNCNHYKHTLTVEEFRQYITDIPKRLERDSVAFRVGERFGIISASDKPVAFYFEKEDNYDSEGSGRKE